MDVVPSREPLVFDGLLRSASKEKVWYCFLFQDTFAKAAVVDNGAKFVLKSSIKLNSKCKVFACFKGKEDAFLIRGTSRERVYYAHSPQIASNWVYHIKRCIKQDWKKFSKQDYLELKERHEEKKKQEEMGKIKQVEEVIEKELSRSECFSEFSRVFVIGEDESRFGEALEMAEREEKHRSLSYKSAMKCCICCHQIALNFSSETDRDVAQRARDHLSFLKNHSLGTFVQQMMDVIDISLACLKERDTQRKNALFEELRKRELSEGENNFYVRYVFAVHSLKMEGSVTCFGAMVERQTEDREYMPSHVMSWCCRRVALHSMVRAKKADKQVLREELIERAKHYYRMSMLNENGLGASQRAKKEIAELKSM